MSIASQTIQFDIVKKFYNDFINDLFQYPEILNLYSEIDVNDIMLNRALIHNFLKNSLCKTFNDALDVLVNIFQKKLISVRGINFIESMNGLFTKISQVSGTEIGTFFSGINYIDRAFVLKTPKTPQKHLLEKGIVENVNFEIMLEFLIGRNLNDLKLIIPNIMYTYSILNNDVLKIRSNHPTELLGSLGLIVEYVEGFTLDKFLASIRDEDEQILSNIIYQIILALRVMYNTKKFTHRDLHTNNILIKKIRKSTVKYDSEYILVDFIPVIIDYGSSSIEYFGKFIGVDWTKHGAGAIFRRGHGEQSTDIVRCLTDIIGKLYAYSKNKLAEHAEKILTEILKEIFINDGRIPREKLLEVILTESRRSTKTLDRIENDVKKYLQIETSKTPHMGYPIYNDQTKCDDAGSILKNIFAVSDNAGPCCNDPWLQLEDWTDRFGRSRYWYDCGQFYFDGTFNVVKFPKGMSFYHGSQSLARANAEFPFPDYYNSQQGGARISDAELQDLIRSAGRKYADPKERRDYIFEKIQEKLPISTTFYGDINVAKDYSSRGGTMSCGDKCVMAYKLKRDAVFINIYDPYNILVLLTTKFLDENIKQKIIKSYRLTEQIKDYVAEASTPEKLEALKTDPVSYLRLQYIFEPFQRFFPSGYGSHRSSLRQTDGEKFEIPNQLLRVFNRKNYAGYINPRTLDVTVRDNIIPRFAEIVFGKTIMKYVERDTLNKYDWQYNDNTPPGEFKKLLDILKVYKNWGLQYDQGNLYQKSIWTTLYIQKEINDQQSIWITPDMFGSRNLLKVISLASLLCNIGKTGTAVFSLSIDQLYTVDASEIVPSVASVDADKLLREINMVDSRKFLLFLIESNGLFRKYFNTALMERNLDQTSSEYLRKIIDICRRYNPLPEEYKIMIKSSILLEICDIMGQTAFVDIDGFDNFLMNLDNPTSIKTLNAYLEPFPFITNQPQIHTGDFTKSFSSLKNELIIFNDKVWSVYATIQTTEFQE